MLPKCILRESIVTMFHRKPPRSNESSGMNTNIEHNSDDDDDDVINRLSQVFDRKV